MYKIWKKTYESVITKYDGDNENVLSETCHLVCETKYLKVSYNEFKMCIGKVNTISKTDRKERVTV